MDLTDIPEDAHILAAHIIHIGSGAWLVLAGIWFFGRWVWRRRFSR